MTAIIPANAPAIAVVRPDQNPAAVYLAGLGSPTSRQTMRQALDAIARLLGAADCLSADWPALRYQHTAAVRAWLAGHGAPATANKHLAALRGVLKAAWRLGQMGADDYQRAVDLEPIKGERIPAGRALTAGEIAALFAACDRDSSPAGARDGAMLALLRVLGLRRAEVAGLALDDYNPTASTLRVLGKRNKQRELPVTIGAADRLAEWLAIRGPEPGPLFCAINKAGRITLAGLSGDVVFDVLERRALEAGVVDVSPHDLRRTFAGDLLDSGVDIATVQRLMGHSTISTTARYDRRGEAAKRRAVTLLLIPHKNRVGPPF